MPCVSPVDRRVAGGFTIHGFTILFEFLAQGVLVACSIALSLYMAQCPAAASLTGFLETNPTLGTGLFVVVAYTLGIASHSLIFFIVQGVFGFQGKLFLKEYKKEATKDPLLWLDACRSLRIADISGKPLVTKRKLDHTDAKRILNCLREYLLIEYKEAYDRNVVYRNEFRVIRGLFIPLGIVAIGSALALLLDTAEHTHACIAIGKGAVLALVLAFLLFTERLARYYKMVLGSFRMAFLTDGFDSNQGVPSTTQGGEGQVKSAPSSGYTHQWH